MVQWESKKAIEKKSRVNITSLEIQDEPKTVVKKNGLTYVELDQEKIEHMKYVITEIPENLDLARPDAYIARLFENNANYTDSEESKLITPSRSRIIYLLLVI